MPRAAPSLKSDCGLRRRRCAQAVDAVFRSQAGVWGELAPRYRMGRPTRACVNRKHGRVAGRRREQAVRVSKQTEDFRAELSTSLGTVDCAVTTCALAFV